MEYRAMLFKSFHGIEEEKKKIAQLNKLLQNWKV